MKVGDKVVFFIPPTAEEAELAKRKAKHMPQYRGPATITKVMTPTTYELQYDNRTYKRCLSELRPYRATGTPNFGSSVAPDTTTSFEVGAIIAYRDTDDPDNEDSQRFHIGKVTNIADGNAHVHCYATSGKALSWAKWSPLYQNEQGAYKLDDRRHGEPVMDMIPVEEDEWMLHYAVQLNDNKRLSKQTRRQLESMAVTHHRLGHTFP